MGNFRRFRARKWVSTTWVLGKSMTRHILTTNMTKLHTERTTSIHVKQQEEEAISRMGAIIVVASKCKRRGLCCGFKLSLNGTLLYRWRISMRFLTLHKTPIIWSPMAGVDSAQGYH